MAKGRNKVGPRTFPQFSRLPKEIRLMIWFLALPGPRVVNIRERPLKEKVKQCMAENAEGDDASEGKSSPLDALSSFDSPDSFLSKSKGINVAGLTSDDKQPSILFVSRESFDVASKVYQLVFSLNGCVPATYFSFKHDTLYLRYDNYKDECDTETFVDQLLRFDDEENIRKVENLAILLNDEELDYHRAPLTPLDLEWWLSDLLFRFQGVKKVSLVLYHYANDNPGTPFCFIDPIDFEAARENYEAFLRAPRHREYPLIPPNGFPPYGGLDLDLQRVAEIYREERGQNIQLPQVGFHIAVTEEENEGWIQLQEKVQRCKLGGQLESIFSEESEEDDC